MIGGIQTSVHRIPVTPHKKWIAVHMEYKRFTGWESHFTCYERLVAYEWRFMGYAQRYTGHETDLYDMNSGSKGANSCSHDITIGSHDSESWRLMSGETTRAHQGPG